MKTLKQIYGNTNSCVFNMAVAYTIDKGLTFTKDITDEQIDTLKDNGMMTKSFVQHLVRTAREIALACGNDVYSLITFCASNGNGIHYDRMEEIATQALHYIQDNNEMAYFLDEYDLDISNEEAKYFDIGDWDYVDDWED